MWGASSKANAVSEQLCSLWAHRLGHKSAPRPAGAQKQQRGPLQLCFGLFCSALFVPFCVFRVPPPLTFPLLADHTARISLWFHRGAPLYVPYTAWSGQRCLRADDDSLPGQTDHGCICSYLCIIGWCKAGLTYTGCVSGLLLRSRLHYWLEVKPTWPPPTKCCYNLLWCHRVQISIQLTVLSGPCVMC